MEILKHEKVENTVTTEFKINGEEFETALESAYLKKRKNIAVPGFRKGKATRKMIEQQYGEGVFYEEAINGMYHKIISDVIDELAIDVVDMPDIEVTSVDRADGVGFKASFVVKPDVSINGYLGIEVEENIPPVSEDDITEKLKEMQLRGARIIDVEDRAAQIGDTVLFDFNGFCNGEAFQGGEATNFSLELGSGRFIPGFEEQVAGHNIGEDFDVNVTFPEEYHVKELAGNPALFKCKINSIKGRELTELDDEFAKDVSEFDTLDELRVDVKKKLEEAAVVQAEQDFEANLSEKLIGLVEANIPPVMFEHRIDDMVRDWEMKNAQQGMNIQTYLKMSNMTMEGFREMFSEMAEKQVKMRLALEKISALENVEVSDEEINAEFDKLSELYRMSADKVRDLIEAKSLANDLKCEKALNIVKENAKKVKA